MPLDELKTVTARPASSVGDFEVDESWQPGDPLPEYFDESGFPIDPSVVAAMLAERSAASAAEAGVPRAVAGLSTEPLTVGSTIFVDLPEHGISAGFTVSAILPCPTPNPGDGYLVTTKFIHENAEILDLRIEGSADVIGTTASHPFWSEDRQQFIAAGDLRVGENLRLADDTTRKVESLTRRETRETVYNIEVDGEHVFYVGNDGVLVHNSCRYSVYVLTDRHGNVKYWGITKQNVAARAMQHARDKTKTFHQFTVIAEGLTRRQARNIEGAALRNAAEGAIQNMPRPRGGYYHAYPKAPGTGRRIVSDVELQILLDNPIWDLF